MHTYVMFIVASVSPVCRTVMEIPDFSELPWQFKQYVDCGREQQAIQRVCHIKHVKV